MREIDEKLECQRQRYNLIATFGLIHKQIEYSNNPNAYIDYDNNSIVFYKNEEDVTEYEDYRVINLFGFTAMQFRHYNGNCTINLRCFKEGNARVNRGIIIMSELREDGYYHTNTIVTDNFNLTNIDLIYPSITKELTPSYYENCLDEIKSEISSEDYTLFKSHLQALDKLLNPSVDPAQLTLTLPTSTTD